MKHRIILSIALVMSIVLVSLTSSDSTANAQQQMRFAADTGVITLGPNQILRISVVSVDGELGGGIYGVRFKQINYVQDVCNGGVCKHTIASQTTTNTITLAAGEVASYDHIGNFNFRVVVKSNRPDVKVQGIVFDTSTQRVAATIQMSMQRENQ